MVPIVEQKEAQLKDNAASNKPSKKVFTPGLTYADAQAIRDVIPDVEATSAEVVLNTTITREGRSRSGKLVGVDTSYFRLADEAWNSATATRSTPCSSSKDSRWRSSATACEPASSRRKIRSAR